MTAPSTSHGRYQGYPYTNPIVIDAPSIDATTAARWNNLPRKPIVPVQPTGNPDRRGNPGVRGNPDRDNPDTNNEGGSRLRQGEQTNTQTNNKANTDVEPDPRVYIDFPTNEYGEYVVNDNREETRREDSRTDNTPSDFVEETIFYDPFEDRRIKMGQSPQATLNTNGPSPVQPSAPQGGSSSLNATSPQPGLPPYMTKESSVYGSQALPNRLSPSLQEFPEPPPAYTETDRPPVQDPPPRVEVVVPDRANPIEVINPDRKLVLCPFCGIRVYTLPVKENGLLTHVIAIFFFLAFAPLTLLVYCTDYFKYRNHYCPNCNRLVGYEVPMLCQDMVYTKIH